ncbi:MAG: pyridoxal 5'-phosphate synthase glutaminase subunit PdxT [Candidatus Zixiibacteriota bacterium]
MRDSQTGNVTARIGVLALQGDFARHLEALRAVGAAGCEVRSSQDFIGLDALIIPGGESTTMSILLDRLGMREALVGFVGSRPVWGSCAGLILLSRRIVESPEAQGVGVRPLGALDVDIMRNAYGRQVNSFEETVSVECENTSFSFPACFIRAPKIVRVGKKALVMARRGSEPTLVRQANILASTFHSELTENHSLSRYFVEKMVSPAHAAVKSALSRA